MYFRYHGHIPFLILSYDALKPTHYRVCLCYQDPTQCIAFSVKYYWNDVSFYLLIRLNDMLYSGPCFCAKTGLRYYVYFALKWQEYYQKQCVIAAASGLTPICSRFLWTHWHYRYLAFPIHHSNRDVSPYSSITAREVCDRRYHNLGPWFGLHLWPATWLRWQKVRKLNCLVLFLRGFNSCSHLELNYYAAVNVLTL